MQIVYKKIEDLIPYEKNPRRNDEAVEFVANSIKEFGFKVPIVIDKNGIIVTGHTRLKASKQLGIKEVPCIIADDLNEEQIKAFRLADNKVGEVAQWDFNILDGELAEILDINMEDFNFKFDDIDMDSFGEDFELPDGDKSEICQMTFTLHEKQKGLIEYAISLVKDEITETFGNSNSNGNALYEVIRQWAEQKK